MARRSLQASTLGIEKAKKAFSSKGWTQEYLAAEVGIETRQPVWKFFTGKPIERYTFMEICSRLGLNWQEIAQQPVAVSSRVKEEDTCCDLNALVQEVRTHRHDKIQVQCSTIRLLDTAQPIELESIYVGIDILENITSQRWLDLSQLQGFDLEIYRGFGQARGIPAMQAVVNYPKLTILGKPGSGKTALLQNLALKCDRGELLPERIPMFIRLKNFAEDARETGFSLLSYISQELGKSNLEQQQVETLLHHGKVLILLDGLDEVQEKDRSEVIKQIRKLSEEYYKNQLIITCRIAAQEYRFEGFTDVELADFESDQIEAFAQKWFVTVGKNSKKKALAIAAKFMQKLELSENQQIRELAKTPLLLHLACSVFQSMSDFPAKRSDLYKQALDILLVRWDEARGIKRDEIYRHLSLAHKIKLLSQIAATTFEQGQYFFTQSNLQHYIMDYLRTSTAQTDAEELRLGSEAVLKSIEAQHGLLVERARGIYSFSHLTIQEYLTARNIVASFEPKVLDKNLAQLTIHISQPHWREVFLLTAGMLENAGVLMQLMQQYSDRLVAVDDKLQQFLVWLAQKSCSVQASYKLAAISAFYLTLVLPKDIPLVRNLSLALAIDLRLGDRLACDLALDLALKRVLSLSQALSYSPSVERILALNFALPHARTVACDPQFGRSLQQLKEQLPTLDIGTEGLKEWWNVNGQTWIEKLKRLIVRCRNIGHQWEFNEQQKEVLQQYYAAKCLLIDCLNSGCEVTPTVREKIEETLLFPSQKLSNVLPMALLK